MSGEAEHEDGDEPVPTPTKSSSKESDSTSLESIQEELRKAQKALKAANAEAQANREAKRKLQELQDEEDRRTQESLSESEKTKKRISELERSLADRDAVARKASDELRGFRIDREVEDEARKQNVLVPRMAAELLRGRGGVGIDVDEDTGKIIGVKEAVKKLIADYPDQLIGAQPRRNQGTPPRDPSPGRGGNPVDNDEALYQSLKSNAGIGYSGF